VQKNPRILDTVCRGPTGSCTPQLEGSAYAQSGMPGRGEPSHRVRPHLRLRRRTDGPSTPQLRAGGQHGEPRRDAGRKRPHLTQGGHRPVSNTVTGESATTP